MSDGIDIGHGIAIPIDEIELRASRSGGPGGQHANKTASRIEASLRRPRLAVAERAAQGPDRRPARARGVTAVSQDARGQARNREIALERLRRRLADAAAPRKQRRPTRPGRAAREERLQAKRRQSERKRHRRRRAADD